MVTWGGGGREPDAHAQIETGDPKTYRSRGYLDPKEPALGFRV